jgi:hypothetical protein
MADQLPHAPAKSLPFCYYSRIAGHPIRERMHEVRTAVCLVCRLVYAPKPLSIEEQVYKAKPLGLMDWRSRRSAPWHVRLT